MCRYGLAKIAFFSSCLQQRKLSIYNNTALQPINLQEQIETLTTSAPLLIESGLSAASDRLLMDVRALYNKLTSSGENWAITVSRFFLSDEFTAMSQAWGALMPISIGEDEAQHGKVVITQQADPETSQIKRFTLLYLSNLLLVRLFYDAAHNQLSLMTKQHTLRMHIHVDHYQQATQLCHALDENSPESAQQILSTLEKMQSSDDECTFTAETNASHTKVSDSQLMSRNSDIQSRNITRAQFFFPRGSNPPVLPLFNTPPNTYSV